MSCQIFQKITDSMNLNLKSPPSNEELLSSGPQSSTDVLSENLSKQLCLHEDSTVIDISASNPLNDLISFRNLEQSLHVIQNTDNFPKSSLEPSYIFRNLLHTPNNNKVEEFSCERGIFHSHLPMDVLSEDENILRDIRNVFEGEGKLKNPIVQIETSSLHQTVDDVSDQGNQDCYDWDKFLERWEGMHVISGSTSEAQHHELRTIEEPNAYLQASLTSKGRKRKNSTSNSPPSLPFNGPTKKRPCIAGSPETIQSSIKSSSSDEEHGPSRKFVLSSFEKEMEIIIHPISSDASETNTSSELEKFIKNTKIKLLEDDPIPPFVEKFISLDPESLPNRANDFYEVFHVDPKDIINLLTKSSDTSDAERSDDETEEVTSDEDLFF